MQRVCAIAAAALLSVGCSSISTSYDFATGTDFAALKTYSWMKSPTDGKADPLIVERVHSAVNATLQLKGYALVDQSPDFFVSSHGSSREKIQVSDWNYQPRGFHGGGPSGATVYQYEEGTLLLDVIQAKDKRLVWRGTARGVINPNPPPEERTKVINEAVQKLLAKFPPPG